MLSTPSDVSMVVQISLTFGFWGRRETDVAMLSQGTGGQSDRLGYGMFKDLIHTYPPRLTPSAPSGLWKVVHISLLFSSWGQPSNDALVCDLSYTPSSHRFIDLFQIFFSAPA